MSEEVLITTRKRGNDYDLIATVNRNGSPEDFTGATDIRLLVDENREVPEGGTPDRDLTGAVEGDATNGQLRFDMTASGSPIDLAAGEYYAEITWLNAQGRSVSTETWEFVIKPSLSGA